MKQELTYNIVKAIGKFIDYMYKPSKIEYQGDENDDFSEYVIWVYFDSIPDSPNPYGFPGINTKSHKERKVSREIRASVENYFGFKTTGFQKSRDYFPPMENHPLNISVILIEQ